MVIDFPLDKFAAVALRKESVDRNTLRAHMYHVRARRSPQGERG